MEQYALYLVLKDQVKNLDSTYKCSFNDMDSNATGVVGIYVKSGGTPRRREISTGEYYNYSARVQFIIQGDNTKESLMSTMNLASSLRKALIRDSNLEFIVNEQLKWVDGNIVYDPTNKLGGNDISVLLIKVSLLGEVDFKGKTTQGLPKYSINFRVEYYCKEVIKNGN